MKKLCFMLSAALLLTCLAACGGEKTKAPFDPETTAQTLLDTPGVFTETLERLDRAVVEGEYGLEGQGASEVVCWYSPGGTAEEVTVVTFEAEASAEAFVDAAWDHIADQKEANESYRPAELPKLEKAVVERRDCTVLVLVCADYDAALAAIDG